MASISSIVTLVVSAGLMFYAIKQYLKLKNSTSQAIQYVKDCTDSLDAGAREFRKTGVSGEWALAWHRYASSMLNVPDSQGNNKKYTAVKPETIFTLPVTQQLFGLDFRAMQSLPSNLTGIGITFTFAGLVYGVLTATNFLTGSLSGSDSDLMGMIKPLLEGAGLAFTTSLSGLVGSIGYSVAAQRKSNELQGYIDNWNQKLRDYWPTISQSELQMKLIAQQGRQIEQMDHLKQSVAEGVTSAISDILKDIRISMEERDEASARMIESKYDNMIGSFNTNIEGMSGSFDASIDKLTRNFNRSIRQMAGDEMEHFVGQLKSLHADYVDAQKQIIHDKEEFLDKALEHATNALNQTKDMSELLEKSAGQVAEHTENIVDHVNDMRGQLGKWVVDELDSGRRILADGAETAGKVLITASEDSKKILVEASLSVADGIDEISTRMMHGADQFEQALKIAGPDIAKAMSLDIKSGLNDHQSAFNDELKQHIKSQTDLWNNHTAALENIYKSHGEKLSELSEPLDSSLNKMREELLKFGNSTNSCVSELDQGASQILHTLSSAIDEMQRIIDHLATARMDDLAREAAL